MGIINHVAIGAHSLERALRFYVDVLGMRPYHTTSTDWAMVELNGSTLSLILIDHAIPVQPAQHPAHFGITVETRAEVDEWHLRLKQKKLDSLQTPKEHRDQSYGFYLKDSEGNFLEIIHIPPL